MPDSATELRQLTAGQASPEVTVNALFDAAGPATLFGVDWIATSGLTLQVYGGNVLVAGVIETLAKQTALSLTASATNYVEFDPTGSGTTSGLRINTTGFTAGRVPLWTITCSASAITSWTDERAWGAPRQPRVVAHMSSDANRTLTAVEARADIIEVTSVSLTATRNVVLPLIPRMWIVANLTTGGQSLQFIGATGSGITVANGKRAIVMADGTNIVRVTVDAP